MSKGKFFFIKLEKPYPISDKTDHSPIPTIDEKDYLKLQKEKSLK